MEDIKIQDEEKVKKYLKIITILKAIIIPFANFFVFLAINFAVQNAFSFVFVLLAADESLTKKQQLEKAMNMFSQHISLMYSIIVVLFLGIFMLVHIKKNFSEDIDLKYKAPTRKMGALSVVLGIFVGIGSNIVLNLIANKLPDSWIEGNQESVSAFEGGNFILTLIATGICVPIFEELLFRGLIYNSIKKIIKTLTKTQTKATQYFTVITAAVVTSFLFGIYHGNILQALYTGILSLFMVYAYEKSGSIVTAIIIHSMFNISGIPLYFMVTFIGEVATLAVSVVIICITMVMVYKVCSVKKQEIQSEEI